MVAQTGKALITFVKDDGSEGCELRDLLDGQLSLQHCFKNEVEVLRLEKKEFERLRTVDLDLKEMPECPPVPETMTFDSTSIYNWPSDDGKQEIAQFFGQKATSGKVIFNFKEEATWTTDMPDCLTVKRGDNQTEVSIDARENLRFKTTNEPGTNLVNHDQVQT